MEQPSVPRSQAARTEDPLRKPGEPPLAPGPDYIYRRQLDARELLPAIAAGIGVGAVAFYIARLFLQRTPLDPGTRPARTPVAQRADD